MKKNVSLQLLADIKITNVGLTDDEVRFQQETCGRNIIVEADTNQWIETLRRTISDPMLWLLLGVGIIFGILGSVSEALTMFVAILPLAGMDTFLHYRTQSSFRSLEKQLSSEAQVLRNGEAHIIPSKDVVPGDLLKVSAGDFLAADGYFALTQNLQVDESTLTGEAMPVKKNSFSPVLKELQLPPELQIEEESLGFAGTRVLRGEGLMRVTTTGKKTAYGEIIAALASIPLERTPLQKSITKMVQILTFAAIAFCLFLAGIRLLQGKGWLDALLSAASLGVAAVPEEFPLVFTFFLSVGVFRMAKIKALVKRGVSIENMARVNRICTDKTGTLTMGELHLTTLERVGIFTEVELIQTALAASDESGKDPVDVAIGKRARDENILSPHLEKVFPFTESRKKEAAIFRTPDGRICCGVKGAPETILSLSRLTDLEVRDWQNKIAKWADEGNKVLACARKIILSTEVPNEEPAEDFEFMGLMIFEDPVRPEALAAVKYCAENKISILMLTGDHPRTAMAVAKKVLLGGGNPNVVSAEEHPEKFTAEALDADPDFLLKLDVAARCNPWQKLWIVSALKKRGYIVAFTGDGVNDVPALKAADVSIAMGVRGTQSAREGADIVLADDNFGSLVAAIHEGKQLFSNLRVSFHYLLLIQIPLVLTAAFIPLLGYPILFYPIHMVWLELIIHPSALFAFQKSPVRSGSQLVSRKESVFVAVAGLAITVGMVFVYVSGVSENKGEDHARAIAIALLVIWSAAIVLALTRLNNAGSRIIFAATVASCIALTQFSFPGNPFHFLALDPANWLQISMIALGVAVLFTAGQSRYFFKSKLSRIF